MNKGLALVSLAAAMLMMAQGAYAAGDRPWWERERIRYFWTPWEMWVPLAGNMAETTGGDVDPLSDAELLREIAALGATVFVDRSDWTFVADIRELTKGSYSEDWYRWTRPAILNRAGLARKYGMRYFAHLHSVSMPGPAERIGARLAVNKEGKTSREDARAAGRYVPCPLDEQCVDEWLFKYAQDMARTGLVDGAHMDWEFLVPGFRGYCVGDDLCYCDDCWANYGKQRGLSAPLARADRYSWLDKHRRLNEYLRHQQDRLISMYRRGAASVRAIKADFIFAAYDGFMPGHIESRWFIEGAALGLHSPAAPFFVVDASHYYPNHTAPWWDVGHAGLRALGMKHLLGYYTSGFMGMPTMDVGAARQLYDAAINTDGYWVWSERKWGPSDYAVLRTADRLLRAAEVKVGDFLMNGELDCTFVTPVEQSGDPELGRNVISRAYRLGDRRLAQINNVNTDHSVSVLVRFPRVGAGGEWTVRDPLTELCYARQGKAVWNEEDLDRGVLVTMDKRSDAWLVLAPWAPGEDIDPSRTMTADLIKGHPDRPAAGPGPGPGQAVPGDFPLVFSRSGPLGYRGAYQPVLGASIFFVDAGAGSGSEARQVFAMKGNCWSPMLSPDRTRVVFSSYVNGRGQIYTANADATVLTGAPGREQPGKPYWVNALPVGTERTGSFAFQAHGVNLSKNEYCDHSPVWSPDGGRIAFVTDRDGDWEIYVMSADGSEQRRLTRSAGADLAPAWSPDGRRIAFESDRTGDFGIYVIGSDATDERALVVRSGRNLEPVWSPDGGRIAFVGNQYGYHRDIMLVEPDSGAIDDPRGLLHAVAGGYPYRNVHGIRWSPDGTRIAAAFEGRSGSGVFVVRVGSMRPAADAADVATGAQFTHGRDRTEGDLVELVTAPPLRTRPGGVGAFLNHGISGGWYMSGDASNRWIVRTFRDLAWSPDGETVAFRSDMDSSGYAFFYTVPASGGEPVRLDDTLSPMGVANVPTPLNPLEDGPRFVPAVMAWRPPVGMALLAEAPEFWLFRTDPDRVGETEQWFGVSPKGPPWSAISTHEFWDKALGTKEEPHYIGDGWYAVDLVIPPAHGKRVWLSFGAVDENYTLWLNGEHVADNLAAGAALWDQPVSVEITGEFREGQSNHVVVRVRNTAFAGGIWKPVRLLVER